MYETLTLIGALVWFATGLWLAVSLVRAVVPKWRASGIRQTKMAALGFVLTFIATIVFSQQVYRDYGLSSREGLAQARAARQAQEQALAVETKEDAATAADADDKAGAASSPADRCGGGTIVAVRSEYQPRSQASETAGRIVNAKATSILGKTHYHQVDSSTSVRVERCSGGWTEVSIVEPAWLSHVRGWVPDATLRAIERTPDGARVYVESDVGWDEDSSAHKQAIVTMINRIGREHEGCASLDPSSVAKSPSRSGPNDPVFFVTCDLAGAPFNVWFRPADTEKAIAANRAIGRSQAVLACEQAARARAAHPSTVDFSKVLDVAYFARGDGRVSLDSSFTAKNGFNLELTYRIRCLFDGDRMIEANISEAG